MEDITINKIYITLMILAITLTGCSATVDQEEEVIDFSQFPYETYLKNDNPVVTITVEDYGDMKLQLFPDLAKNTVDNFIKYIYQGSYEGSTFHRIIEDFMIQGGIVSNPNCQIQGEFSSNGIANDLSHQRGVISMARTSIKNSATSQFFIVHNDSVFLDGSYAGFGGLISGFDILDQLAGVSTNSSDGPLDDVVITSISIDLKGYEAGQVSCAS
ncbi:peptidylprolyl isomerase [Mariniplasma anaerobium]|uniref:Peptidyl-prolyl cis-trans isomerase n=1 Tax=Mariniplasma anaerobium TaxID=2735436 RepID=A0A7U9XV35_9MOLU|nr:peptidylprolyl isomerase [Mariniplasma anaerobium]BCR35738.1 peptidyl-prolyl cis-trans isomerase [Mariniplasma anaerobium]